MISGKLARLSAKRSWMKRWLTYFSKIAKHAVVFTRDFSNRGISFSKWFPWFYLVLYFLATWVKLSERRANEDGNNPIIFFSEEHLKFRNHLSLISFSSEAGEQRDGERGLV